MRLPDFVIIGAQKAGTTWLGYRLLEQPSVFLPRPLETHFFDRDDNYAKGLPWYTSRFESASSESRVGEKTPDYFWTIRPNGQGPNDIPERMHLTVPDAKLIVVLRDPVKRAVSAFNHLVRARWISPFADPDEWLGNALTPSEDRYGLAGRGLYLAHLKRFLDFYAREQIHVVFFEDDVIKAPHETIKGVMEFLGLPMGAALQLPAKAENRRMNSRLGLIMNYYAPVAAPVISLIDRVLPVAPELAPSAGCHARLSEYFAPHNQELFNFLGRRAESWISA